MNKMILIGNLTKDPVLSYTPTQIPVCNFTIAVNQHGSSVETAPQFFRITVWRKLGENCAKYLAKGRKVFVSGPLTASVYETADGQHRVSLDVTASDVEFLSSQSDDQAGYRGSYQAQQPSVTPQPQQTSMDVNHGFTAVEDDELPF